jgi:hypothetical protein
MLTTLEFVTLLTMGMDVRYLDHPIMAVRQVGQYESTEDKRKSSGHLLHPHLDAYPIRETRSSLFSY